MYFIFAYTNIYKFSQSISSKSSIHLPETTILSSLTVCQNAIKIRSHNNRPNAPESDDNSYMNFSTPHRSVDINDGSFYTCH